MRIRYTIFDVFSLEVVTNLDYFCQINDAFMWVEEGKTYAKENVNISTYYIIMKVFFTETLDR